MIGLNDKDTKKQEIEDQQAQKIISNICLNNTAGATVTPGHLGIFKHQDGTTVIEKTISVDLLEIEKETVIKICKEIKTALNQESILLEEITMKYDFI